jgi:hypothetical protein
MVKFLIICCFLYILLRFFVRYLFPFLLGSYVNKKMSEMGQNHQSGNKRKQPRDGEVTIDYQPKNKKQYADDTGEYIDYEEIK